jgi:hypothetical protein
MTDAAQHQGHHSWVRRERRGPLGQGWSQHQSGWPSQRVLPQHGEQGLEAGPACRPLALGPTGAVVRSPIGSTPPRSMARAVRAGSTGSTGTTGGQGAAGAGGQGRTSNGTPAAVAGGSGSAGGTGGTGGPGGSGGTGGPSFTADAVTGLKLYVDNGGGTINGGTGGSAGPRWPWRCRWPWRRRRRRRRRSDLMQFIIHGSNGSREKRFYYDNETSHLTDESGKRIVNARAPKTDDWDLTERTSGR